MNKMRNWNRHKYLRERVEKNKETLYLSIKREGIERQPKKCKEFNNKVGRSLSEQTQEGELDDKIAIPIKSTSPRLIQILKPSPKILLGYYIS